MPKPAPVFQFAFPTPVETRPPFIQVIYGEDPLDPVPIEMAKQYSRFMAEGLASATSPMPDLYIELLPLDETVDSSTVQTVIQALSTGRVQTPMTERLAVLRACRLLKVDVLKKAIEDHLNKGCNSRPDLKLQCLQEVFDLPEEDQFRADRVRDARENFHVIANTRLWPKLNADIVRELLNDDTRLKAKEMDLYCGVLRWLACNPAQIPGQCDRLISMIRFGGMSTEEKFACLEAARRLGLDIFIKPYLIDADWYRTCLELNHPEFTDVVEYDRLTHFIGENRRKEALAAYYAKKGESNVDSNSPVLQRVMEGKIDGGTWLPRPKKAVK